MKKYFIYTYGCQMNVHESGKIAGILSTKGMTLAQNVEEADVVVFNTCCIRESAEQKIMGNIGALKPLKKIKKDMIIAVCGCMSQQKEMSATLRKKFPFINIIFGANNIEYFGDYLDMYSQKGKFVEQVIQDKNYMEKECQPSIIRDNPLHAYVNIMYGCNNFCTYCIVPYVRGREKSRKPEDIYKDVRNLITQGYKVITLLGQNVNSYGNDDSTNGVDFATLLETVANFEGDYEIRFMTSHPKDLNDKVINVMAKNERISKSLHLPVQAGSNKILKAMNRNYTREQYFELINKIRTAMPNITLSTDIIVGFPSETEEDYLQTEQLLKDIQYHNAFIFMYSKRSGTPAEKMDGQIDITTKRQRIHNLLKIQHKITEKLFTDMIGNHLRVLVENEDNFNYIAKAQSGKVVLLDKVANHLDIGKFYYVLIIDYKKGNLIAKR